MTKLEGTVIINNCENYSNDKVLFEGMNLNDAYSSKSVFAKFQQADIDKDGKISADEINRYNGPVAYGEFYPGLTLEKADKNKLVQFQEFDANKDGVLSINEVQAKMMKDDALIECEKTKKEAYIKNPGGAEGLGVGVAGVGIFLVIGSAMFGGPIGIGLALLVGGFTLAIGIEAYRNNKINKAAKKADEKCISIHEQANKLLATQNAKLQESEFGKYMKLFTSKDSDGGEELTETEIKMLQTLAKAS